MRLKVRVLDKLFLDEVSKTTRQEVDVAKFSGYAPTRIEDVRLSRAHRCTFSNLNRERFKERSARNSLNATRLLPPHGGFGSCTLPAGCSTWALFLRSRQLQSKKPTLLQVWAFVCLLHLFGLDFPYDGLTLRQVSTLLY